MQLVLPLLSMSLERPTFVSKFCRAAGFAALIGSIVYSVGNKITQVLKLKPEELIAASYDDEDSATSWQASAK